MRARTLCFVLLCCLACAVPGIGWSEQPKTEELLPDLELVVPENQSYKKYLGLPGESGEKFKLSAIKADILLIELFSMYCPYCQKEAPNVNELYRQMEQVSKTGPVVKIIGLGASNSQFEVDHFKETYDVPFPLFPDKDMSMYKALGGAGTPGFIGCRLSGREKPTVILRNSGGFYQPTDFLKELIDKGTL